MRIQTKLLIANTLMLLGTLACAQAQFSALETGLNPAFSPNAFLPGGITVYDSNLGGAALGGYSEVNAGIPIYGDALNMPQGGALGVIGLSLFNSTSGGNTGSILTGNTVVKFYDNTVPYAGGAITGALLGSATLAWDFTASGGLAAGFYTVDFFDISSSGIVVPKNILVTQQFSLVSGTSLRNGVVLFPNALVGSSPNNVYLKSSATPENLYTFSGAAANSQFGYYVEVIPEPATVSLVGLGLGAFALLRRSRR